MPQKTALQPSQVELMYDSRKEARAVLDIDMALRNPEIWKWMGREHHFENLEERFETSGWAVRGHCSHALVRMKRPFRIIAIRETHCKCKRAAFLFIFSKSLEASLLPHSHHELSSPAVT
jgi:hypothetical protein